MIVLKSIPGLKIRIDGSPDFGERVGGPNCRVLAYYIKPQKVNCVPAMTLKGGQPF